MRKGSSTWNCRHDKREGVHKDKATLIWRRAHRKQSSARIWSFELRYMLQAQQELEEMHTELLEMRQTCHQMELALTESESKK